MADTQTPAPSTPSTETQQPAPTPEQTAADVIREVFAKQMADAEAPVVVETPAPEGDKPEGEDKPTEEQQKPEDKKPEDEKVSKKLNVLLRAEQRASKERQALRAERAEIDRQKKELEEKSATFEKFAAAKDSPSALLELAGYDPKTFFEKLADEVDRPAKTAAEIRDEQERAKREKETQERLDRIEREREAARRAEAEAARQHQETALIEHVASSDQYPNLVNEFTDREIVERAWDMLLEPVKDREGNVIVDDNGNPIPRATLFMNHFGRAPSDEEIAQELEKRAAARVDSKRSWRERLGQNANKKPSQGSNDGQQESNSGQTDSVAPTATAPRTLTNAVSAQRASVKAPEAWTQAKADEESLAIIRALKAS